MQIIVYHSTYEKIDKSYTINLDNLEQYNIDYSLNTLELGNGNAGGWNKNNMYIVARAQDELQSNALKLVGVNKTVLAEHEMGEQIAHNLFNPNVQEYMSMNSKYGISKILVPKHIQGKSLKDLNIGTSRDKYNLTALGIVRSKNIILNPDVNEVVKKDDILLIAGNNELIDKLTD